MIRVLVSLPTRIFINVSADASSLLTGLICSWKYALLCRYGRLIHSLRGYVIHSGHDLVVCVVFVSCTDHFCARAT